MGMDGNPIHRQTSISKHAFFDLSHVSPLVFLYLLKECYSYGTCKATAKFRALQQQLCLVLLNNCQAGPATLIAHCLYILPIFESYCDGFSHLVISSLCRFLKRGSDDEDVMKAKECAAKLFLDIVNGTLAHDNGVLIKIVQVFKVNLADIDHVMCDVSVKSNPKADSAKEVVEQYVLKLMELQSYMTAVDLLIHFSISDSGESYLLKMMECRQMKAAEKWATYLGKPMQCLLVQEYVDQRLLQPAYDIIKKNNLRQEFPELHHQSKESSLKKLAEKGVWDIAEIRANGDRKLLEYLVYLAMEAGYIEKVEELCDRYSIKGFFNSKEPESDLLHRHYLNLHELCIEDVLWVDEVNSLRDAISYFEKCIVVGVDCEWKPNYEKGSRPNKVSIMQIASEKKVYILDLIKLYEDVPSVLDECLGILLHSSSILKLGYNFQCDVRQLALSYRDLNCFKHFEMLLDIQNVFKEPRGGLSGLAEKILGIGLNKTRRNSNWEQRPLSHYQLEYAALDAAVLLHIFRHVGRHSQPAGASDGNAKIEWKSHIISHMDSSNMPGKDTKMGDEADAQEIEH
ncbi:Polynucleotidyl transferase [Perilla frutescens var. hirtella]|uniref:Polynucleotidyl transferase n=1 Tax=Perilla frutescens var. hirtella TaxID=608512 RepID=A0AAD4P5A8_PERFH|nr:Polynucleotidyl transferase [Perilla frutescens var. hirtella]